LLLLLHRQGVARVHTRHCLTLATRQPAAQPPHVKTWPQHIPVIFSLPVVGQVACKHAAASLTHWSALRENTPEQLSHGKVGRITNDTPSISPTAQLAVPPYRDVPLLVTLLHDPSLLLRTPHLLLLLLGNSCIVPG
jgi:hypothetical protein